MRYMIANGSTDEKREILGMIQEKILLNDKKVYVEKMEKEKPVKIPKQPKEKEKP